MLEKLKKQIVRRLYAKRTLFLAKEANRICDIKDKNPELADYYEGFFAGMDYAATIYGFVEDGVFSKYVPFD